jgi:hypothetical protein
MLCVIIIGNGTASWKGNVNFRKIIWEYRKEYLQSGRFEKTIVALRVFREISKLDPPGRFLQAGEKNSDDEKSFVEISKERAIEKICQALREKTMKAPPDNYDSDSSHSGRDLITKKKKKTAKKARSNPKKFKREKKKASRKKPKAVVKTNSHGTCTANSNMGMVRRSIRMNENRKEDAVRDCSAYSMVSPLKSSRLPRNDSKTTTLHSVPIQSPPTICGRRDTLPFEFYGEAQLNREAILKMSRHVPTSSKMSNGYNLYDDYKVPNRMNLDVTTYDRRYYDADQTNTERLMEGRSFDVNTKNWNYAVNDEDAAVAGTLINFDEYDFTFNDREAIGNEYYDASNVRANGMKSNCKTDGENETGKPPRLQGSPEFGESISSPKVRGADLDRPLTNETEKDYTHTTAWEDRFDDDDVDLELDTKPESQEGVIRMITPTQEDFYDDISDTSSLFSSESITPVDGTPWKLGVSESEKHWLTPSARKAQTPQNGAASSSTYIHFRGKSLSNLYKARKGPGQYDNVFEDDDRSNSIDGELAQWNSSVPV